MKVELELKNGKRKAFPAQIAKVLVSRGIGVEVQAQSYQTREIRAQAPSEADELSALKAEADRRGIKYHHRAGVTKLRELLES